MGESLILRRLGARNAEGKYAWKKSGTVLVERNVNYSGSLDYSGSMTFNYKIKIISIDDTSYFTEETFINAEINRINATGNLKITLLADGKCSYNYSGSSAGFGSGEWSYDAQESELNVYLPKYGISNISLRLSGSGISLQPTIGFIGYVVDNDATKYPDNGTQGEYTYVKLQN